jgi:hypothetical protein
MERDINSISVVYLSYVPFGISQLNGFIENYIKYRPTLKHDLVILYNGYKELKEIEAFNESIKLYDLNVTVLLSPEKFDIGSYFYASSCLSHKYILFLNTYSRFINSNWLEILFNSIKDETVGVVGCSGAWSDLGGNHLYRGRNLLMRLYSLIVYRFNFYPRITPHIRTNAFIIRRDLFLSLVYNNPRPNYFFYLIYGFKETKLKTFCFEHGINSMTNQLIAKGYDILLTGINGKTYKINNWIESQTFWHGDQKNLLIQDNQTQFYNLASESEKKIFENKAWQK